MKTALVTGASGQDGAYLSKLLLEKDYKIYGLMRRQSNHSFTNLEYLGVRNKIEYVQGDMTDEDSLINIIKLLRPDEVYNLAAQSFVGISWDQARLITEVNSLGVLYLLEAIKNFSIQTKFYQASTSEMFGDSNENGIQTEETPFHPKSPYAISKLYAYWITNNFKESYGMFCVNGILFNHESPIRGLEFVTRKITDGVARIKLGIKNEIRLGNLESRRDWGFAGDYMEAVWLMMQHAKPDNYIISTGETHSIRDFLEIAFQYVGIKTWEKYIKLDPKFSRPVELLVLQGKSNKAEQKLGWKPKVKFEALVKMMIEADIKRVEREIKK